MISTEVYMCVCESFFRLKAQLIRRTQDLCVESSDMTETKYDSTYLHNYSAAYDTDNVN